MKVQAVHRTNLCFVEQWAMKT